MHKAIACLIAAALITGCASQPSSRPDNPPHTSESAPRSHGGKIVGGASGAAVGGAMAYSSAGILCTLGGPLCVAFVIPAALLGGVIGMAAGSVVDAVDDSRKKEDAAAASEAVPPPADTAPRQGG